MSKPRNRSHMECFWLKQWSVIGHIYLFCSFSPALKYYLTSSQVELSWSSSRFIMYCVLSSFCFGLRQH